MISGLVIHLSNLESLCSESLAQMRKRPGVMLGDRVGLRLPIVVESTESHSAEDTTEWVKSLPGVLHADVTFVHFEDKSAIPVGVPDEPINQPT